MSGRRLALSLTDSLSRVVGHSRIKRGLVLGLVSREHVYIEGPPGVAKTMLAETMAAATDLDFFFYQMHRDTRLVARAVARAEPRQAELIGEAVVVRSQDPETGGELIRQHNKPGGVLTAHLVCQPIGQPASPASVSWTTCPAPPGRRSMCCSGS